MLHVLLALFISQSHASVISATGGGTINTSKIQDDAVDTEAILTDSVTEPKIINGAVSTGKLNTDAVTAAKILNGAIETLKIATDSITAVKIINLGINTTKLDTDSVTGSKILNATVASADMTTTGVTAGTYGDSTNITQITVDAQGRITTAGNVAISAGTIGGGGTANRVARFTASGTIGNANITDNDTTVAISSNVTISGNPAGTGNALAVAGSTLTVANTGTITAPSQPRIGVGLSGSQTIASNLATRIYWDTTVTNGVDNNIGNLWVITSSDTFTARGGGMYYYKFCLTFDAYTSAVTNQITFQCHDGSQTAGYSQIIGPIEAGTKAFQVCDSLLLDLSDGDTIKCSIKQVTGGSLTVGGNTAFNYGYFKKIW